MAGWWGALLQVLVREVAEKLLTYIIMTFCWLELDGRPDLLFLLNKHLDYFQSHYQGRLRDYSNDIAVGDVLGPRTPPHSLSVGFVVDGGWFLRSSSACSLLLTAGPGHMTPVFCLGPGCEIPLGLVQGLSRVRRIWLPCLQGDFKSTQLHRLSHLF